VASLIGYVVLAIMHLLFFYLALAPINVQFDLLLLSYLFITLITHQVKIRLDYLFRRFEHSFLCVSIEQGLK
jgi:hypothetical protein